MIIEIALGIVLAVIILALLPYIIGLGLVAIGAGLVVLVAVAGFAALYSHSEVALLAGAAAAYWGLAALIHKKWPHLEPGDAAGLIFFVGMWLMVFGEIATSRWETEVSLIAYFLVVLIGVFGGLSLRRWNQRQFDEWQKKEAVAKSYGTNGDRE